MDGNIQTTWDVGNIPDSSLQLTAQGLASGEVATTTFTDNTNFNSLTSYQVNCAPCYTSQLHLTKTGSSASQDYVFREDGINCEMCHGPAQAHLAAMTSGAASYKSALPVHFSRIGAREYVAICGQCHAQSALHQRDRKAR